MVQQDSFIEDQRQALSERSSSCTSLSRPSSRPSSLIEQEKQRSLEKQRQELASLQRQQTAHAEEKRRREKEWELREQQLTEREVLVNVQVWFYAVIIYLVEYLPDKYIYDMIYTVYSIFRVSCSDGRLPLKMSI